jgi:crotonobetainyl-CoA:carnitine CoA-transferase CaiB-like acyl-CoA transferase
MTAVEEGRAPGEPGPLSHIRVLDFTALVQGPIATQLLADLGADVIKIEKPGGEWMRHWGILDGWTHGETDSFLAFNRNKRSVTADLKDPALRARILALAETADVVVENFRPGVMARLGLGYEDFRRSNPEIIYASSSGYGQSGPASARPGQDLLIQALSGIMFLTGRDDDPPSACGIGISDQYTGLHLAIGILAALLHRERTGAGQQLDVDLLTCTIAAQQQELTYFFGHGEMPARPHHNFGSPWATAPFGVYRTADGHLALAMTPCPELGRVLGVDWLDEYATNASMAAHRDEIYAALSAHFRTETTEHWIELMTAADVWCAPVQDHKAMVDDPQVRHLDPWWEVGIGRDGQTFRTVGSPIRFSATPARLRRGVPRTGQHTEEVLGEEADETGRADTRSR